WSVRATTRPARRIVASCSGVLSSIDPPNMGGCSGVAQARVERVGDALSDLVGSPDAVDLDQQTTVPVDGQQRLGLGAVDLLAVPDDLLRVIRPTTDLRALEQTRDQLLLVDDECHHGVQLGAE